MALETELESCRRELPRLLASTPASSPWSAATRWTASTPPRTTPTTPGASLGVGPFLVKEVREKERVVFSYLDIHPPCRP